jgi:hypothetical protein
MKDYENLWIFMIFHNTNKIFLVKSFTFVYLQCTLLTFVFTISDFEIWLQNFSFAQTISNFQTCLLWKLKKSILQILNSQGTWWLSEAITFIGDISSHFHGSSNLQRVNPMKLFWQNLQKYQRKSLRLLLRRNKYWRKLCRKKFYYYGSWS